MKPSAFPPSPLATAALLFFTLAGLAEDMPLGQFDGHGDVGSPRLAGSATYDRVKQEYSLAAAGANMWGNRDEFHFLWKRIKGDFVLHARVEFIGKGVDPHRKLGWIVRSSLDADSAYADAAVHGDGLTSLQFRRTKGAITEQVRSPATAPDVIRFERRSNEFIFAASRLGQPFVTCQTNLSLGDEVYAGLFLCSHHSNQVERAVFRDVRIIRPAKTGWVPYRDDSRRNLEILETQLGRREWVLSFFPRPSDSPDGTPPATALINGTSAHDSRQ